MNSEPTTENAPSQQEALERLIYCINHRYPRLFRWHDGHIEWRPKWRPRRWKVLI